MLKKEGCAWTKYCKKQNGACDLFIGFNASTLSFILENVEPLEGQIRKISHS